MKKILSLALVLVMVLGLAACGSNGSTASTTAAAATDAAAETTAAAESEAPAAASNIKVGFIFLHDENSTYDLNFMNAARQAIADLGLTEDQYLFRTNIPRARSATMPLLSWPMPAAISSSPTPSATRITSSRLLRNSLTCSSATPPAPRPTPRAWPTTTTLSLPSIRAATWPVLLPV